MLVFNLQFDFISSLMEKGWKTLFEASSVKTNVAGKVHVEVETEPIISS